MKNFDFYIPILDAGSVEKDSVRFLDVLGSFFNWLEALNRFGMVFSVFTFFHKNCKVGFLIWGAGFWSWALGFASVYVWERIRVEIWIQKPLHWCMRYLIFMAYFQIFSTWISCQFAPNLPFFVVHESSIAKESKCCIKRFTYICFSIFSIFYLIKWINCD